MVAAGVQKLDHVVLRLEPRVFVQFGDVLQSHELLQFVVENEILFLEDKFKLATFLRLCTDDIRPLLLILDDVEQGEKHTTLLQLNLKRTWYALNQVVSNLFLKCECQIL